MMYLSHGLTKEYVRLLIEKRFDRISRWRKDIQNYRQRNEFLACVHNKAQGLTLVATKSQRRDHI